MRKKFIENEIKREVNSMLPENMLAEIKQHKVVPEKVNKNISVIHEKNRHSIVPLIASCLACVVICCAVFLPIAIKSHQDYNNWLADQRQEQEEKEKEEVTK